MILVAALLPALVALWLDSDFDSSAGAVYPWGCYQLYWFVGLWSACLGVVLALHVLVWAVPRPVSHVDKSPLSAFLVGLAVAGPPTFGAWALAMLVWPAQTRLQCAVQDHRALWAYFAAVTALGTAAALYTVAALTEIFVKILFAKKGNRAAKCSAPQRGGSAAASSQLHRREATQNNCSSKRPWHATPLTISPFFMSLCVRACACVFASLCKLSQLLPTVPARLEVLAFLMLAPSLPPRSLPLQRSTTAAGSPWNRGAFAAHRQNSRPEPRRSDTSWHAPSITIAQRLFALDRSKQHDASLFDHFNVEAFDQNLALHAQRARADVHARDPSGAAAGRARWRNDHECLHQFDLVRHTGHQARARAVAMEFNFSIAAFLRVW